MKMKYDNHLKYLIKLIKLIKIGLNIHLIHDFDIAYVYSKIEKIIKSPSLESIK